MSRSPYSSTAIGTTLSQNAKSYRPGSGSISDQLKLILSTDAPARRQASRSRRAASGVRRFFA